MGVRAVLACVLLAAGLLVRPAGAGAAGNLEEFLPEKTFPGRDQGQFGYAMTTFNTNSFLVGEPFFTKVDAGVSKRGSISLYRLSGSIGTFYNPAGTNGAFGQALAVVDSTRFVVTAPANGLGNSAGRFHLGRVSIQTTAAGTDQASFQVNASTLNPSPQVADGFGTSVATVGGKWIVVGAPKYDAAQIDAGRVHLFSVGTTNTPLVLTISDPTSVPGALGANFGHAVSAVGLDRFMVSAPYAKAGTRERAGKLYLYSTNGTLLKTINDPTPLAQDRNANVEFGSAVAEVGVDMLAISAPGVDHVSATATNLDVGAVYLFHKSGQFLRTIPAPAPTPWSRLGDSIARLGTDRFLVGTILGGGRGGQAHLFSTTGDWLTAIDNPKPNPEDRFGHSLAGLGSDWFVVGANLAPPGQLGAAYLYNAQLPLYELGQEIAPPSSLALADLVESGPEIDPVGAAFWHRPSVYEAKLYATRAGRITVRWKTKTGQTLTTQALNIWPPESDDYQIHVAQTPPVDLKDGGAYHWAGLMDSEDGTGANAAAVGSRLEFSASGSGRSLLMLAVDNPIQDAEIYFQLVRTVTWDDLNYLHDHSSLMPGQQDAPANIGEELDALGYHDTDCGGPWVFWPNSFYNADPDYYDRTQRTGPIIPVNRDQPTPTDDMVVVYYNKSSTLRGTVVGMSAINSIAWPYQAVRYHCDWPGAAETLVIADGANRQGLDEQIYVYWELYVQNHPSKPGFNPNDEHALQLSWGGGYAIFPLRDDLGRPDTSEPYVLIKYFDGDDDLKPKMKAYKVVAGAFNLPLTAGDLIQPPAPLGLFQKCPQSTPVSGPYWPDRKGDFWARAAGNQDGQSASIVMRYFYRVQDGFYFPSNYFANFPSTVLRTNVPAAGTCFPWLDLRASTPGTPHNIQYTVNWPTNPPVLFAEETLVRPKRGLPDISSQSSVQIIYQQGIAVGQGPSVALIDPTREREAALSSLPESLATFSRAGKEYFPKLPPHLRNRLLYDPINKILKLRGEFVEPALGESYLLLNALTAREKSEVNTLYPALAGALNLLPSTVIPVAATATNFDTLALTAGFARRHGFVTLAFGNNADLSPPAEPISLAVIRVECPPYRGEIKVVESDNPFDELLTLRHSGDFAGSADQYRFQWKYAQSHPDGSAPSFEEISNGSPWQTVPPSGIGAVDIVIKGPGVLTLGDKYFVCRYQPVSAAAWPCTNTWSEWTPVQLAEGWIKRVLKGINPFEQRFKAYDNNQINTIVSMLSQAGPRFEGDVPLSLSAADKFGLIEIYETVLRRGLMLSIDGGYSDTDSLNAILLASGRLADLYMLLGNEAYADAADPTIAFGTDDGIYGAEATSIHCFMNQTSSLLEEELALLRGRDDSFLPLVSTPPIYNRLAWNFTRDINGGEVAYSLNYNIRDESGDVDGTIDEVDAKVLYPQGHGDAWGHYLTALKYYYRLLRHPNFSWAPRTETVLVGGAPVAVDYLDERKFARAAAAKARTGAEIVDLTYRRDHVADLGAAAADYRDVADTDRAWGVADWGNRAGQGAYLDWVVANALLPDRDPTLTDAITGNDHTGIQIVDRTTVTELREIGAAFQDIQAKMDAADNGLNPLGLAENALPFDISPQEIDAGRSHFDQIYDRAVAAMNNAITVFNHANNSTQLLRRQADHQAEFSTQVDEREMDFNNRLIELFGYPYEDDIGPAGTYPTGYDGPDIYHFDYYDPTELLAFKLPATQTLTLLMREMDVDDQGALTTTTKNVKFHISTAGLGLIKPSAWTKKRRAHGELQMARSEMLQTKARFEKTLLEYDLLAGQIQDQADLLKAQHDVNAEEIQIHTKSSDRAKTLNDQIRSSRERQMAMRTVGRIVVLMQDAIAEALPQSVGMANDVTSPGRSALRVIGAIISEIKNIMADTEAMSELDRQNAKELNERLDEINLISLHQGQDLRSQIAQLEQLVRQEIPLRLEIYSLRETLQQTGSRYMTTLARGQRLLEERLRFRQQTAVKIQAYRYKDMAFRIFRNDALQKYRAQFDLAALYVHLAAKAFDFETCLPPDDDFAPASFTTDILRARSLGFIQNGQPQIASGSGEIGLADPLAWMHLYWTSFAKHELGFNNPQTDTGRFSLRTELFRILRGETGNAAWRETLSRLVVPHFPDLPEVRRYCILPSPLSTAEPALVIPFSTTASFAHNFFAWPLGGGDNFYDSTHNATKIRSVGVWFANYNNLTDQGLANTPHVYLVPVGADMQRCPPDDTGFRAVREWKVLEQKLPIPFRFNSGLLQDNLGWIPFADSLPPGEEFGEVRKHPMFRAYHDSGTFNPSETINSSRLIGRSVWNNRWLLIIPGGALHHDRWEGLQRLIHGPIVNAQRTGTGISDIKLFFQTYSYAGN